MNKSKEQRLDSNKSTRNSDQMGKSAREKKTIRRKRKREREQSRKKRNRQTFSGR